MSFNLLTFPHAQRKEFSAEEVSSMVLVKMKEIAQAFLRADKEVKSCSIASNNFRAFQCTL